MVDRTSWHEEIADIERELPEQRGDTPLIRLQRARTEQRKRRRKAIQHNIAERNRVNKPAKGSNARRARQRGPIPRHQLPKYDDTWKVKDLKKACKSLGLARYSKWTKAKLIEELNAADPPKGGRK